MIEQNSVNNLDSYSLENALWSGFSQLALTKLMVLVDQNDNLEEQKYSAWGLIRWFVSNKQYERAVEYLPLIRSGNLPPRLNHLGPILLIVDVLIKTAENHEVWEYLQQKLNEYLNCPDLYMLAANASVSEIERLNWINRIYENAGLMLLNKWKVDNILVLDNLQGVGIKASHDFQVSPKISVIMPVFNAVMYIETALRGVLSQTWSNLEVIVVDDHSSDYTVQVVEEYLMKDSRIKLIKQPNNMGVYAARNTALKYVTGDFITNHDADDWSHPQRMELMIKHLLEDSTLMAVMAYWIRCDTNLYFQRWRVEGELIHESVSTILFRRSMMDDLGGWDEVRAAADSELLQRIRAAYGNDSVKSIFPGIPLVFARQTTESLTMQKATHLKSQFVGTRRLYREISQTWHAKATTRKELCMQYGKQRPFPVPALLLNKQEESVYDWVIYANYGKNSKHYLSLYLLVTYLVKHSLRIALFHWADFDRIEPMEEVFLTLALDQRLEIILAEQCLKTDKLIFMGVKFGHNEPDDLPEIRYETMFVTHTVSEISSILASDIRVRKHDEYFRTSK